MDLRHRAPCKTLTTRLRKCVIRRQTIWLPPNFGLCTVLSMTSTKWLRPFVGRLKTIWLPLYVGLCSVTSTT
ncbi:hypothetical protein DPMN_093248 [Dreissena polymorpha]|uniref:Uncharacterized protein n=1 Tax=Dreissena polymorpha TaxID=45954 RepID=A0A9D4L2L4_DREPO|nr:hypothetical protein DPMN_093248 [Dreissena polymorpha]